MIPYKVKIKLNYWHLLALRESFLTIEWPLQHGEKERDQYRYLMTREFLHLVERKLADPWEEKRKERQITLTAGQLLGVHAALVNYCHFADPELLCDFRAAMGRLDKALVNMKSLQYAD